MPSIIVKAGGLDIMNVACSGSSQVLKAKDEFRRHIVMHSENLYVRMHVHHLRLWFSALYNRV